MKRWGNIGVITIAVMTLFCASKQKTNEEVAEGTKDTTVVEKEPVVDEYGFFNLSSKVPLPDTIKLNGGTVMLDFLGWSNNSKYLGFGEKGEGADPFDNPHQGFGEFWIVDVPKDEFMKGVKSSIHYGEEVSVLPSEVDAVREEFAKKATKYGVSGNRLGEKLELTVLERTETCERIELKSQSDKTYELVMNKDFKKDPEVYGTLGRFELSITNKSTDKKTWLQKAGKYHKYRQGYAVHSVYIDPTNTWIAVFTVKIHWGFEGQKEPHFMVNTGRLP